VPRPPNGYVNAAGQAVPGTHDPISRYMDRSALMHWAHKRGMEGLPLYARDAIDIGSAVHAMADLDLKGRPDREIENVAREAGHCRDNFDKAMRAFMQFRKWRVSCRLEPIALEISLVSEIHQYGGTPDCIALINERVSLVEFKTSAKPFADHLVAMAAHAALWNENNHGRPIEAFHWIGLPKDGGEFQHHAYADLSPQWEIFLCYLECWRLEKGLIRKRTKVTLEATKVAVETAVAVEARQKVAVSKPRRAVRKRADVLPAAEPPKVIWRPQTMAEILRTYGHIRDRQLV
jgi:hypothetical protein